MNNYTKEDIIRLVEEEDVEFIRLQFTDLFGNLKNAAVTAFRDYLKGPEASAIFKRYGFTTH